MQTEAAGGCPFSQLLGGSGPCVGPAWTLTLALLPNPLSLRVLVHKALPQDLSLGLQASVHIETTPGAMSIKDAQ